MQVNTNSVSIGCNDIKMYFLKTWTWCGTLVFEEVTLTRSFLFSESSVHNKVSLDFLMNISKRFPTLSPPTCWGGCVSDWLLCSWCFSPSSICSCLSCQSCVNFVLLDILGMWKLARKCICTVTITICTKEEFYTVSCFIKQKLICLKPKDP